MSITDAFEFYSSLELYQSPSEDGTKLDYIFHSKNAYGNLSIASSLLYPVCFQVPSSFCFKRDFLSLSMDDLYKGSFSFYYLNQRHRAPYHGPAFSDGKGRIEYWYKGFKHRPSEEGPAVRVYESSKKSVYYSYYTYGKQMDFGHEDLDNPNVQFEFVKYFPALSELIKNKSSKQDTKQDTKKIYIINPWDDIF